MFVNNIMLSTNKTSGSSPIALDTADKSLIYYHKSETGNHNKLVAKGNFEPFFPFKDQLVYISSRRGAGKSTFCNTYIKNYVEATDGRVFIVSRFDSDPSIELPKRGMFIKLNQIQDIEMKDMKDSLIVFDDIHSTQLTPQQAKILQNFVIDVCENSRHHNLSALITSHQATNYSKTRAILNESNAFVFFPQFTNRHQIERALKVYYGLNDIQIDELFNITNSRWVMVNCINPKYILTQKEVWTFDNNKRNI